MSFKDIKYSTNNRKILLFNQYYLPLTNPPAKRLSGLAEYLTQKGWDVRVVTGMPNYPNGTLRKGYRALFKKESINGVWVYRTCEIPLKNSGYIKRLLNYVSFAITSLFTVPLVLTCDVAVISTPPLISAVPYFYMCRLFRRKVVLDVRDMWPEAINDVVNIGNGFLYKLTLKIANAMYRHASLIICTTRLMAKTIKKRTERPVRVITNFATPKELVTVASHDNSYPKIRVVYTGIVTKIQNLGNYLLLNSYEEIKEKFEWHIVGDGEDITNLIFLCRTRQFDNVLFHGYRDELYCSDLVRKCDCCLVSLNDTTSTKIIIPYKFIEYSSYGKPIIANSSEDVRFYMNKYKPGLFIDFSNINKTLASLKNLTKQQLGIFSKNSFKMFYSEFNRDVVLKNYYKLINNV